MIINRTFDQPSCDTFSIPSIRSFVRRYLDKSTVSIDPFARNERLATHTNDINPDTIAEHHMDALDFLKMLREQKVKADLLLFDPPYSLRQLQECYEGMGRKISGQESQRFYGDLRDAVMPVLTDDAVVLSFGWNSIGIGRNRGFEAIEVLLVCHGRAHNDTICTAERRVQSTLFGGLVPVKRASAKIGELIA